MNTVCINMHQICIKYASNMQKKKCRKYAENMPLHKLQHSKYADYMQKTYAKKCSICNKICKKYAKNMRKSMYWHILHIYMHSPLC